MKTELRVIFNDNDWAGYCLSFGVSKQMHRPAIPPSFPVLVVSTQEQSDPLHAREPDFVVGHSFVEMRDLRRALNLK